MQADGGSTIGQPDIAQIGTDVTERVSEITRPTAQCVTDDIARHRNLRFGVFGAVDRQEIASFVFALHAGRRLFSRCTLDGNSGWL